jgi:hypothetical protein
MSRVTVGLFVGLILGLTAAFGSFGAFMIVVVFGAVGLLVGMVLEGRVDLQALIGRASAKR